MIKKTVVVTVKASLHKKLKRLAKTNGITLFELVDDALKKYLE